MIISPGIINMGYFNQELLWRMQNTLQNIKSLFRRLKKNCKIFNNSLFYLKINICTYHNFMYIIHRESIKKIQICTCYGISSGARYLSQKVSTCGAKLLHPLFSYLSFLLSSVEIGQVQRLHHCRCSIRYQMLIARKIGSKATNQSERGERLCQYDKNQNTKLYHWQTDRLLANQASQLLSSSYQNGWPLFLFFNHCARQLQIILEFDYHPAFFNKISQCLQ